MVIVKNARVYIPFIVLVILVGLIFTLAIFRALFKADLSGANTPGISEDSSGLSASKIYFQGPITTLPNVPQKTVVNPQDNSGLSIYWIKASSENGNDTCTLYDGGTGQIYATSYQTNGQFSGRPTGSMYYQNNVVKKDKTFDLLKDICFKS